MITNIQIIQASEGETLGIAGGNYRIIISGEETGGSYAVIEMTVPPGGGPPPHAHPDMQEMFHVIEGELEFKTESTRAMVKAGGFINIPLGGAVHCFRNVSDTYAKMLCTVVPSGLENLFREIGTPAKHGEFLPISEMTPERMAFLKNLDEKYGMKSYPRDFLG